MAREEDSRLSTGAKLLGGLSSSGAESRSPVLHSPFGDASAAGNSKSPGSSRSSTMAATMNTGSVMTVRVSEKLQPRKATSKSSSAKSDRASWGTSLAVW